MTDPIRQRNARQALISGGAIALTTKLLVDNTGLDLKSSLAMGVAAGITLDYLTSEVTDSGDLEILFNEARNRLALVLYRGFTPLPRTLPQSFPEDEPRGEAEADPESDEPLTTEEREEIETLAGQLDMLQDPVAWKTWYSRKTRPRPGNQSMGC